MQIWYLMIGGSQRSGNGTNECRSHGIPLNDTPHQGVDLTHLYFTLWAQTKENIDKNHSQLQFFESVDTCPSHVPLKLPPLNNLYESYFHRKQAGSARRRAKLDIQIILHTQADSQTMLPILKISCDFIRKEQKCNLVKGFLFVTDLYF